MRCKTDPELGLKIREHLTKLGLETLCAHPNYSGAQKALSWGIKDFLMNMGLDVLGDPSIKDTPTRVAEMFVYELCAGLDYNSFPKCTTTPNGKATPPSQEEVDKYVASRVKAWEGRKAIEEIATEGWILANTVTIGQVNEMVMVDTINTVSFCEHHFQTIAGVTHIAYIPKTKLLGLSKFARVTDFFARRPQIQERMTEQIYAALSFILETPDVAVQQVCTHNCMRARGAMDPHSKTTTSKVGGKFFSEHSLRQEFLHAIK